MKKFLLSVLAIFILAISVGAVTFSTYKDDVYLDTDDLYFHVYSNLNYPKNKEAKNVIAFTITVDGKIKDIHVIESGGEEFDNAVMKAIQTFEFGSSHSSEITSALMFDNDRILNKLSDIYLKNEEKEKYNKRINIDADFISKELPEWNSFRYKSLNAYVKIGRDGRAEKAILIQSCGNKVYDDIYIEKIKKRQFKVPYKNLTEQDLQFIFTARPLSKAKMQELEKYNNSVGQIIFYKVPYSQAFKPRTIVIQFTVLRNGQVRNAKVLSGIDSPNFQTKYLKSLSNIAVQPIPQQIDLSSITFVMIIKKNAEYYPQFNNRNARIIPLLP